MLALLPMDRAERKAFLAEHAECYAADMSRTQDLPMEEARARVAAQRRGLSPDSPMEHFHHLVEDDVRVGRLWLSQFGGEILFVSYIEILPEHRGKGYGKEALTLVETTARRLGARQVWLHVFADNAVALALYRKAGFRESGLQMFKNL